MRRIIYIIMLAIAVASCTGAMQQRLGEIESAIDTDSASAYGALLAVDTASLTADDDRALYDLLIVEKAVKNYEPITPDIIMRGRRAADYYSARRLSARRADAIFYLGRAYQDAKDYPSAIGPALAALDDATALRDTFRMAKAHDLIADVYRQSYLVGPGLPHRRTAKDLYTRSCKLPLYHLYSIIYLADCLYNNDKYQECIAMLDSNESLFNDAPPFTYYYYKSRYIKPYIGIGRKADAKLLLHDLYNHRDDCTFDGIDYSSIINIYIDEDSIDKADQWFSLMKKDCAGTNTAFIIPQVERKLRASHGDFAAAYRLLDSVYRYQTDVFEKIITATVEDESRRFYKDKNIKQQSDNSQNQMIIITVTGLVLILLLALFLLLRYKAKKRVMMLEMKIDAFKELNRYSPGKDAHGLQWLFNDITLSLNKICDQYFQKKEISSVNNQIYVNIEKELSRMKDRGFITRVETEINRCYDNIVEELRLHFPGIREDNIVILLYLFLGFPTRTICFLLDISADNYYSRRKRLKKIFDESDWNRKEDILKIL